MTDPHLILGTQPDAVARTTGTLVTSAAERLASLWFVSGADAVGAQLAGFVALGRQVSATADGARLRRALELGRAGTNCDALWTRLGIGKWLASASPSPLLDELHNHIALLVATDLFDVLDLNPGNSKLQPSAPQGPIGDCEAIDCLMGLWAFGRQVTWAIEALAEPTLDRVPRIDIPSSGDGSDTEGPLLR